MAQGKNDGRRRARRAGEARAIATMADVRAGIARLRRVCPTMRRIHDTTGDPPLRRDLGGFAGLVRVVVGQQLSIASASAIWGRLVETVVPLDAGAVMRTDDAALRRAGLSQGKIRTLRTIAQAVLDGALDLDALADAPEETLREGLMALKGIGPWTADIYLMFCLGRGDAFAPGDLALQLAAQSALSLKTRPSAAELEVIAERWRPWRAVAARLLWSHYAHERQRAADPLRGNSRRKNRDKTQ